MSLCLYPRFDSCGSICMEEGLFRSIAFDHCNESTHTYIPPASDHFWGKNYLDSRASNSPHENDSTTFYNMDLENQYPYKNLWCNGMNDYACNDSKNSKIWRPFSPTACQTKEEVKTEVRACTEGTVRNNSNLHHTIMPSGVKIEPSKSSVFKPFKKKSYNCTHCNMTYLTTSQLMSHMRIHTGSKPYRCDHCLKTFSRNEELTRHRRIHSGYKPHLCPACGKRFGRKDHLAKHRKTHLHVSEKKVYLCCVPGCGHRYTRSDALTRHKSTAHRK